LDVPNFFWDSEPTLHPLYFAIREYFEITPRIKVLNERCKVFLELAEILSDSIADTKMSKITWIIIFLIVISIAVTTFEVGLRFAILKRDQDRDRRGFIGFAGNNVSRTDFSLPQLDAICGTPVEGKSFSRADFTASQLESICGLTIVERTFAEF
jgi:hypothetical protein